MGKKSKNPNKNPKPSGNKQGSNYEKRLIGFATVMAAVIAVGGSMIYGVAIGTNFSNELNIQEAKRINQDKVNLGEYIKKYLGELPDHHLPTSETSKNINWVNKPSKDKKRNQSEDENIHQLNECVILRSKQLESLYKSDLVPEQLKQNMFYVFQEILENCGRKYNVKKDELPKVQESENGEVQLVFQR